MKIFYFVSQIVLLSCSLFCHLQPQEKKQAQPWHFPGKYGYRFPIVASNFPRHIYNVSHHSQSEPSADTLFYFLRKAYEANFTIVRTTLSPSFDHPLELAYYRNFIAALKRVNNQANTFYLTYLSCDGRLTQPADFRTPASLKSLYDLAYLYGFSVDEPYEKEFSRLSIWCDIFNATDATAWYYDKLFYVNLFGVPAIPRYQQYLASWLSISNPRLLSFDNYPVWDDVLAKKFGYGIGADWTNDFFLNLEMVRQVSALKGIPFWNWVLVHKHWSTYSVRFYRRATEADIRLQVYSSLAYGSKGILYYNFWNPPETFHNNGWHEQSAILDSVGNETDLYDVVRQVNKELLTIGDTLLQLSSRGVYHSSVLFPREFKSIEKKFSSTESDSTSVYGIKEFFIDERVLSGDERKFKIIKSIDNPAALAGMYEKPNSTDRYVLLVNKNRTAIEKFTVVIERAKFLPLGGDLLVKDVITDTVLYRLDRSGMGWEFAISIGPGDGKLLRLTTSRL